MQYIILDMEWNQAWPGSSAARQPLPSPMRGEIVQIGAVRMSEDQEIGDEFQVLIRPKYFKKMNSKVAKLTGIRDSVLREHGVPFGIVFTKADKLSKTQCEKSVERYRKRLSETWEELPPMFVSSSEKGTGREEILAFIDECLRQN